VSSSILLIISFSYLAVILEENTSSIGCLSWLVRFTAVNALPTVCLPDIILSIAFLFLSNSICTAVEIGLSKSLVLSTLLSPISAFVKVISLDNAFPFTFVVLSTLLLTSFIIAVSLLSITDLL